MELRRQSRGEMKMRELDPYLKHVFANAGDGFENAAALLRRERDKQLRIDPEWTTVELGPELFDRLVEQLKRAGDGLQRELEKQRELENH
jgi:hypothetical protein